MRITALAGGIGASKFLLGLNSLIPSEDLTIITNTGDDIELMGLRICPDLDTVTYTLAGIVDDEGWGIAGDTFECLDRIARYGGPAWFNLGDRDLATHIYRTEQLRLGSTLQEVTDRIRRSLGVSARILPMTDSYAPTRVVTDEGEMHFQEYFVGRHCQPRIEAIRLGAAQSSIPAAGVTDSILNAHAVIVCPSNPFISIGPILAVPGICAALEATRAPVVAITPIVAGRALKGPAAVMLQDLGYDVSAKGVVDFYGGLLDGFVLDQQDAELESQLDVGEMKVIVTDTMMSSFEAKQALAKQVLDWLLGELECERF